MQKNTDSDTLMIKNTVAVIMIVFSVLYIYINMVQTRHSASFIKGSMMRPQAVVIPRKEPEKQETKTTRK